MALEHPRYFIKHGGVHNHELSLQPRGDSDYGLRTKTLCPVNDACIVSDKDGNPIVWDLTDVGHNDHIELSYPFKVSVLYDGVTETLLSCSEDTLLAHPIALPLHEDLEIRLSSMLEEAHLIEQEGGRTREELKTLMAEPFEEEDVEEMCQGTFFSYFSALHNHHGIRVMLKFEHIPTEDGEGFMLHFRAAKILVPHGRHMEDFFRHEHSIASLEAQNRIVKAALESSYEICGEMLEDKHTSSSSPEEVPDEALQVNEPIAGVTSTVKKAAKGVGSAFSKAGKAVGKAGKAVGRRAASAGRTVGRTAVSAGRTIGRGAASAGRKVAAGARKVGTTASSAAGRLKTAASSAAGRVRTAASSAAGSVKTAVKTAATNVSSTASRVRASVAKKAGSVYDKVSTKASEAKTSVAKRFGQVKDSVKGARDSVKDRLKGAKDSVRDKVQSLRGKRTGGSSSSSSSSSVAVPQDKTAPVVGSDGKSKVAGVGTSGDARAPGAPPPKPDRFKGQAGSSAPPPQPPPKPSVSETNKGKAAAAATSASPAAGGAQSGGKPSGPPRRFGEAAPRTNQAPQASVKPDDGLAKYNVPASNTGGAPPKSLPSTPTSKPAASSFPSGPAPKPAASAKSTSTQTITDAKGNTRVTTTTNKGDGTSKVVTSKLRTDGTTKVTRTKTAADGSVTSTEKRDTRADRNAAAATKAAAASSSKADKQPKEKKQGVLSKLKDKYDQKKQQKGSSSKGGDDGGNSGGGNNSSGGSGGVASSDSSSVGQGDSATRPDYDRQMRDEARQKDQDRQQDRDNLPPETINFGRKREDLATAVVAGAAAGAVTGAVVAAASTPQAPLNQRLPPGYVLTANGIMALGPDGRVYPLTADQNLYLQQYQQTPPNAQTFAMIPGQPPAGGVTPPPAQAPPRASPNQFTPTSTARLADDDEPLAVQDTSPPLRKVPEQRIADDINETQDQERREVLIKYLIGQHGVVFGRSPTKQQKDKLRARIMAIQRPFIMTKVIEQYTSWLVTDVGVKA
jgi:hypothetical protein